MWIILVFILMQALCVCGTSLENLVPHRSIYNFGGMIFKVTGRHPVDFINYGNWCGLGGKGEPLDDVDRCCQLHDGCYAEFLHKSNCNTQLISIIGPYINNYDWEFNELEKKLICRAENSECKQFLCLCDKICAECMASNTYNLDLNNVKKINKTLNYHTWNNINKNIKL